MKITINSKELSKDSDLLNKVIKWMNYYIDDIDSYNELTVTEKKILSQQDFKKLTIMPARQWN